MDYELYKNKKADRSLWPAGPWDNEPDFDEWFTSVGYKAWAGRLDTGAWFLVLEAPCPTDGVLIKAFCACLRHKSNKFEHQFGMISRTDREDIGGYTFSMEHWECPGPARRDWFRGPYKTLEDVKKVCEEVSQHIFDVQKDGEYVNYFQR